jgi:hypothetical protein
VTGRVLVLRGDALPGRHRDVQPMLIWRSNGTADGKRVCQTCGKWVAGFKLSIIPRWQELPVVRDYRGQTEPCAVCGGPNSEYHHWAPRSLFDDYEKWPCDWLCPSCHRRWHETTGVATA